MITIKNYINGTYYESSNNEWLEAIDPSTGVVYGKLPNSTDKDVEEAYKAANNAFASWSKTSVEQRSEILYKIADLIVSKLDTLAVAESMDNGKPLSLAKKVDIPRAALNFRFFSQAITQFYSESHEQISQKNINFTLRQPHWCSGLYFTLELTSLPLYMENSTSTSRRKLRSGQA